MRRQAASAALVALLAIVSAACGGGGDDDDKVATSATTTSTVAGVTSTVDPNATSTTVEGTTDTTVEAGPGTTVGTAPPATAPPATAPPVGPAPLTPAAPGLYRYTTGGFTNINGNVVPFPAVTTNYVDAPTGSRQHASRDLRSSGNGPLTEYTFEYRPDGVYLVTLRLTTTYSGQSDTRDLTPPAPLLFLATGAAPGASRTLDIPVPSGGTARVVVDVVGTEPVTVGGATLDTLVVRSVATLPPGQVSGTQSLTVNLDRASRLWVRERGVADATATISGFTLTVHNEYTATIQSLSPS